MKDETHPQPATQTPPESAGESGAKGSGGRPGGRGFPKGPQMRAHKRHTVELDCSFSILIPEETFQPVRLKGRTNNLSAGGMKILVHEMPVDVYKRVIHKRRYARIRLRDPDTDASIKVTAVVVWFDFHRLTTDDTEGDCIVGVSIDAETTGRDEYLALMERLASSNGE